MKQPLRPALPVLLVPLALAWTGIIAATELTYQNGELSPFIPLGSALLVSIAIAVWFKRTRTLNRILLALLALCLAFGSAYLFYSNLQEQVRNTQDYSGEQTLTIIEDTRHYASSQGSEALLQNDTETVRFRVFWNDEETSLPKGTVLLARCTVKPLTEDQRWLFERGCAGTLSISSIEAQGFSDTVAGALDTFRAENASFLGSYDEQGAALLAGVLLGYREPLQNGVIEQDFVTCGLTHLIAVSGSHLAVIAALLGWLLNKLPLNRTVELGILLFVLLVYVMLTGLQPSAIRSAIMAGVAGCSGLIGRRGHAPSALAGAALVMLLLYPPNAYSIGFWLSVFAVMGITLFANLVATWLSTAGPLSAQRQPGAVASSLALTLTATAATLPLSVPTFAVVSLIGPLANLVVAPLIGLVLTLGMTALLVLPLAQPLGVVLIQCAVWISDGIAWIAAGLASLPGASVPFELSGACALSVGLLCFALLYALWPLPRARTLRMAASTLLSLGFCVALLSAQFIAPRLIALDVGQGDALIVQEQGSAILIDTGASENALTHALARNGIRRLDAVIITHLDSDHTGALGRLRGLVPVENIYVAQGLLEHQEHNEYLKEAAHIVGTSNLKELSSGNRLVVGNTLSLTVLWPTEEATEGSNEESICLLLSYDNNNDGNPEQQALLTGDAESEELAQILKEYPSLVASIIKIGHHGSQGACTAQQLLDLESVCALISVGANNRYGHPSEEMLQMLSSCNVQVYRTDEQGDIICTFNNDRVQLTSTPKMSELQ